MYYDTINNKTSHSSLGTTGAMIERNPDEWITGTEPMTLEQQIYLKTLTREAGENFDATLSKASAKEHIKRLQEKLGQGG